MHMCMLRGSDRTLRLVGGRGVIDEIAGTLTWDWQSMLTFAVRRSVGGAPCRLSLDVGGDADFNVLVNGTLQTVLRTGRRRATYALDLDAPPAATVHLVKRVEAQPLNPLAAAVGASRPSVVVLHGVGAGEGWALGPEPPCARRIEFVGDSDLAAFGVDARASLIGLRALCTIRRADQNVSNSWAHVLARMLGAEPSVVAWSGVGVYQNAYGQAGSALMRDYYERVLGSAEDGGGGGGGGGDGTAAAAWHDWCPQLVVVQVGANDLHGGRGLPEEGAFVDAYASLLSAVRRARPASLILATLCSLCAALPLTALLPDAPSLSAAPRPATPTARGASFGPRAAAGTRPSTRATARTARQAKPVSPLGHAARCSSTARRAPTAGAYCSRRT